MNRLDFKMFKKYVPIAMIFVTCALLACFLMVIINSSHYFDDEAINMAEKLNAVSALNLEHHIEQIKETLDNSASDINSKADKSSAAEKAASENPEIRSIRFCYNDSYNTLFGTFNFPNIPQGNRETSDMEFDGETPVFVYRCNTTSGYYLFCVDVNQIVENVVNSESALELSCIINTEGKIIKNIFTGEESVTPHNDNNIDDFLRRITLNKADVASMTALVSKRSNGATEMVIDGERYVSVFSTIKGIGNNFCIFEIYNREIILETEHGSYGIMLGAAIALAVMSGILVIMSTVFSIRRTGDLVKAENTDPILNCNSFQKFNRQSQELIASGRGRNEKYAVVTLNINKFNYIKEKFDTSQVNGFLRFVANILKNNMIQGETYGHISEDSFAILMYYGDERNFRNRIIMMRSLVNNYDLLKGFAYTVYFNIGVFPVEEGEALSLNDMLDRAVVAQMNNEKHPTEPYIVYDSNIRSTYIREAEIEAKMQNALEKKEFRVFFQPKYDLYNDRIDSAEALVRWYDPTKKNYEMPDVYIPLFEVNGFIVKLDHHIFDTVCQYLADATVRGERVVPISINVSRVTAMNPGFIEHYVAKKRECGIPDGFLVLEFTESFAFENYEAMKVIVTQLKASGFLCSIDDYGSGHSSQNILKTLPMDELKLDKFFISKGDDTFKDETLLAMTIKLGKAFNMKVVQEGVETVEDLQRLKDCSCDVVQGYYYSKPLMMSDFIDFVNRDTSMKSVRLSRGES